MDNTLGIKLEPRLVLPRDEDGKAYIGVYIGEELSSKYYVSKEFIETLEKQHEINK